MAKKNGQESNWLETWPQKFEMQGLNRLPLERAIWCWKVLFKGYNFQVFPKRSQIGICMQ
jgi:hypothetical protein